MGLINKNIVLAWLTYSGVSIVCVIGAAVMTVCWGKGAQGSGIPQLMAYMNGVNYPNTFGKCSGNGYCELPKGLVPVGYRNYETRDESRNIKWFSFFTL